MGHVHVVNSINKKCIRHCIYSTSYDKGFCNLIMKNYSHKSPCRINYVIVFPLRLVTKLCASNLSTFVWTQIDFHLELIFCIRMIVVYNTVKTQQYNKSIDQ